MDNLGRTCSANHFTHFVCGAEPKPTAASPLAGLPAPCSSFGHGHSLWLLPSPPPPGTGHPGGTKPPIHAHCNSQALGAALPQPHSLQLLLCLVRAAGEQTLPASFASLSLVEVLTSKFKFSHLKGEPNPNCVLQLYYCSYTECHIL